MIGKGSFAKVYLASKKENNVQYAIKAFNKEFMSSQHKGKESLINEISVMRNLSNEHLINLYEVYETTNSIYFVVDILNGGELLNRVKDKGSIGEDDIRELMKKLLLALQYLHSKNIMHRDLKPENLLLKSQENNHDIIVADFGLATFTNIKEILFKRCGTPGFVAPEVLTFQDGDQFYDAKCDIFSAGVIFYLLLIGKQPFSGKDYKQILRANKACDIKFNTQDFEKISLIAQDLLMKMLEPSPFKRFSATECLSHPFLSQQQKNNQNQISTANLRNYEVDYLAGVRNKNVQNQDSQDQLGSMALHSNGIPAINGLTDTIGSLSLCSNPNLQKNEPFTPNASLFSKNRVDTIDGDLQKNMNIESPKSVQNRQNDSHNLHKLALKNSLKGGFREEVKADYDGDEQDVSEENSPLSDSLNKLNFERQMKHSPSKCDDNNNSYNFSKFKDN
ncbi:protein kinase domain protein [Ichthyophthirius multifiliis]|uniref:Protein kinase domain protein n=1 Tax=Ichthyophthirius multifiliis TaxID=5932 RepID=G0R3R5_ICHMU|nr:protein kinase domain protein [Ichthyophthirius multifiliis]EGR27882.1 protein kinase domain protein [Ichthyophthirius multifiliis]|eukprot:XP_004027227.1 protein kinase domain protein [Ichthyophthirius multifiliis]